MHHFSVTNCNPNSKIKAFTLLEILVIIGIIYLLVAWATPDLWWPGNYGTRSPVLKRIENSLVLQQAAVGNPIAVDWLQRHGAPS